MSEKPDPSVPLDATISVGDSDVTRALDGSGPSRAAAAGETEGISGREFGTVRVKREIGRGAMGVVYLGHDRVLGRDVALKALVNIGQMGGKEDASAAFLREARAAAAVKHPNLTQIHHADVAPDGTPFLVMEYVDGPSLAQLLRQSGPMKPALVLSILTDVCAAVEELHERDVVHRDLKPSNVLVDIGGDVYVTDFGLAVKRSASSGPPTEGTVAGTPLYMAPEMFEAHVSPRSDIYALGVMAFEMLCGRVPFTGSLHEVRRRHAEEAFPSEALRAKGVAEDLIDLIERATHKKAMFRYKTARELSRAVQQIFKSIEGAASAKADLRRLVIRQEEPAPVAPAPSMTAAPAPAAANSTSYMETLSHIAATKRERRMRLLDPAAVPAAGADAAPPVDRPLDVDIACVQCGYNVRGLAASGKCPECGREIRDSLSGDRLIFADEQWLRVVTAGVATIAWGVAGVTMLYIFLGPFTFLVMSIAGKGTSVGYALAVANFLLAPLFAAVFLAGVFAVTAREPAQPSGTQPQVLRWLVRGAAVVACVLTVLTALPQGPDWFMRPGIRPLFEIPAFATMGGVLLYLAWLVGRVPDVKLAAQARRRGRIVFAIGLALVVAEGVVSLGLSLPPALLRLPSLLLLALTALSVAMLWLTFRVKGALRAVVPVGKVWGNEPTINV